MSKVPYSEARHHHAPYRGRNAPVREGVIQDPTGVWTPNERSAEAARREAAHTEAADLAMAETLAKIETINENGTLTQQEKVTALARITASGHSADEFDVIRQAREEAIAQL